jgi:hypothetical protein
MWRRSIQALIIDSEVLIVSDTNPIATDGHQSLDVNRISLHRRLARDGIQDPFRGEDDDFSSFRSAKVVGQPVDEDTISAREFQVDEFFACAVPAIWFKTAPRAKKIY